MSKVFENTHYPQGYKFNIVLGDIIISSIDNSKIKEVRKYPSRLDKYTKSVEIENCVLKLNQNNLFPDKNTHDRKLNVYNPKKQRNKTYWISKITINKQISKTKIL